ncbi:MAG: MotA/TolQ/ExbB proton channel family protein [Phycisphaerae bacterium]
MKLAVGFIRKVPPYFLVAVVVAVLGTSVVFAQQGAAPDQTGDVVKKTSETSILQLFMRGGWFMVPIVLLSIGGLVLIVERLIALQRSRIIPPGFLQQLMQVFNRENPDRRAGLEMCHKNGSPVANVAAAGIRKMHKGDEAVEKAIEDAGANEISRLRRNLRMLYGVAGVAPMLGLVGTVWGMIQAFQMASEVGLGKVNSLAEGIYTALVTTFAGLLVAIPVLAFYYYFQGKIERIVHEINDASVAFIESITDVPSLATSPVTPPPTAPVATNAKGPGDK